MHIVVVANAPNVLLEHGECMYRMVPCILLRSYPCKYLFLCSSHSVFLFQVRDIELLLDPHRLEKAVGYVPFLLESILFVFSWSTTRYMWYNEKSILIMQYCLVLLLFSSFKLKFKQGFDAHWHCPQSCKCIRIAINPVMTNGWITSQLCLCNSCCIHEQLMWTGVMFFLLSPVLNSKWPFFFELPHSVANQYGCVS